MGSVSNTAPFIPQAGSRGAGENLSAVELAVVQTVSAFESDYLGRTPERVTAYIVRDVVVVRSCSPMSPAEKQLAKSQEGTVLFKQLRLKLFESCKHVLKDLLEKLLDTQVVGLSMDLSSLEGEQVVVCLLASPLAGGEAFKRRGPQVPSE